MKHIKTKLIFSVLSVLFFAACAGIDAGRKGEVIFEDSMTGNWQDNWFLDGEKATLENSPDGLYFAAGTVTKSEDPVNYHAHHAVLWTKQIFSGDILIRFDCTRVDTSSYGVNIIYVGAEGIGTPPYVKDIYAWRDLRAVPTMSKYFTYMNALHISYNVGDPETVSYIRCRRYPKQPEKGIQFGDTAIPPDYDDEGAKMVPGKMFTIEVEKRGKMLTFRMLDGETKELLKECVWDTTKNPENQTPRLITEGRIGLRQMSTKQNIYKNFEVIQL
jgi:hypothetical protein